MAKFCGECGKEVNEKAVICPSCGCPICGNIQSQTQQPIYVKPVSAPFSGIAIAGFVISFLTLIPSIVVIGMGPSQDAIGFAIIGLLIATISVIFSTLGLRKISYKELRGKGLAIAGDIISALFILFLFIMIYGIENW